MKHTLWLRLAAGSFALSVTLAANATDYTFTQIDVAGAVETQVWDINNHGQVAGASLDTNGAYHGFVYSSGSYTSISGPAGSLQSAAYSVSDSGTVVGSYSDATSTRGFIYEGGMYQDFYVPGSVDTIVRGISSNGRYITGSYSTGDLYPNAFIVDRLTNELRLVQSEAVLHGVNDSGVATGNSYLNHNQPLVYDFATNTTSVLAMPWARFRDISNDGTIVGVSLVDPAASFVGTPGTFEYIADPSGYSYFTAEGINDAGWLAGFAVLPEEDLAFDHAFIAMPTAVPEPSTYALMLAGFAALGWRSRRR